MPTPKNTKELADLIEARQFGLFDRIFNSDKEGFFNPATKEILVNPNATEFEQRYIKIHEATHKYLESVSIEQLSQAVKDMKSLSGESVVPYLQTIYKEYPKDKINKEVLARFAELYPYEVLNPTTKTGLLLNKEFAKNLWAKTSSDMIQELKGQLVDVSKSNIQTKTKTISQSFTRQFYDKVVRDLKSYYVKVKNSISRTENRKSSYTSEDERILNDYSKSELLWDSYAKTNQLLTNKINSILASSFKDGRFDPVEARKRLLSEVPELTKSRANTIMRTEYSNIQNISAEKTYRDLGMEDSKFIMLGPVDQRTAESTMEVHQRQGDGLPLDDLKELIKDVATKYHPDTYDSSRPWVIHINTRRKLHRVA